MKYYFLIGLENANYFYTDDCIKPWFVILYSHLAASWLISFKKHPHYYTKNPRPKSSDICHLPRRWAVLSIPPFQTACAPLSLQVWATLSRITYGNVCTACPGAAVLTGCLLP